jgi:Xaa-Pro aminopeptidase
MNGEVEAVVFFDMANIHYLTGFSGSDGALIIGHDEAILLVDGRYLTQAKAEADQFQVIEYYDKIKGIVDALSDRGFGKVGFESAAITLNQYRYLRKQFKGRKLRPFSDELVGIRAVKDKKEIEWIRMAARLSARALDSTLQLVRPGIREQDLALELDYRLRKEGSETLSFDTIVASGKNSALPHAKPTSRRLLNGDFVVIDYGAVYKGYHSDETCTFALGRISEKQKDVYETVKEAHDQALNAVRAGVSCKSIDKIARDCISQAGYGINFSHSTGHGTGLSIHEAPRISAVSNARLEEGMVITIEPGIYLPGQWGVRIEDLVLVRNKGYEVLTKTPKDLKIFS